MIKKVKSTFDKFIESLTPEEHKKFDEEYKKFVLSELILAAIAKDNVSVKKLAKMAEIKINALEDILQPAFAKATAGTASSQGRCLLLSLTKHQGERDYVNLIK